MQLYRDFKYHSSDIMKKLHFASELLEQGKKEITVESIKPKLPNLFTFPQKDAELDVRSAQPPQPPFGF